MAVEHIDAIDFHESHAIIEGGYADTAKTITSNVIVPAAVDALSSFRFFRLPANAIIRPGSVIANDMLSSSAGALFGVGVYPVHNNLSASSELDTFNSNSLRNYNIDLMVSGVNDLVDDPDKWGKPLWQLVGNEHFDERGFVDIIGQLDDTLTDATGNISVTMMFTVH